MAQLLGMGVMICRCIMRGLLLATVVIGLPAGGVYAQNGEPTLDELLGIGKPPDSHPPDAATESGDPQPGDSPLTIDRNALSGDGNSRPADAFDQAVREMNEAADRLRTDLDAGLETQRLQESAMARLEQVIAAARQQRGSGSGSSGSSGQAQQQENGSEQNLGQRSPSGAGPQQSNAGSGGGSTTSGTGPSGQGAGDIHSQRSEWGNLPPRLRDELLQGLNERFSSVYERLTAQYYQRLAEQGNEQ